MKTKFLAGLVATLVALVFVIGISIFVVAVLDVDASKNWFTYTAAFLTIAIWLGIYNKLKPKGIPQEEEIE
jgi:hypothetical protein